MITVFYGDQVWGIYPNIEHIVKDTMIPDGAFVFVKHLLPDQQNGWWYKKVSWHRVTDDEVPPMCKAWLLLES